MDKKVAILVTTYCDNDVRNFMTETILEKFSKTGYYICLTSHTPVNDKIIKYCNSFIYDSDNSMHVDGRETMTRNTPPETSCVQEGLDFLLSKGFTHVFKTNYDVNPSIDVRKIIETHSQSDKKLITMTDDKHCAMLAFFGEIEFIKNTWNYDMLRSYGYDNIAEHAWRKYIIEKGLIDQVSTEYNTDGQVLLIGNERVNYYHVSGLEYFNEYKSKI